MGKPNKPDLEEQEEALLETRGMPSPVTPVLAKRETGERMVWSDSPEALTRLRGLAFMALGVYEKVLNGEKLEGGILRVQIAKDILDRMLPQSPSKVLNLHGVVPLDRISALEKRQIKEILDSKGVDRGE